ncbi:MAG: rod shape-determining protein RodA [Clostridiales bacterium]|nr:rod shape-determining protein RodA [Clostridiales bacterium]
MPGFRSAIRNTDWLFVFLIALLLAVNLAVLKSASANVIAGNELYFFKRQLIWVVVGFAALFAAAFFDYEQFQRFFGVLYGGSLLLLIAVFFAQAKNNAHRWFNLGFMDFQPSELAKLALIIALACFFVLRQDKIKHWSTWLIAGALTVVPMLLIFKEPDLGTALVLFAVFLPMLWMAGVPPKVIIAILLVIVIVLAALFIIFWDITEGFTVLPEKSAMPSYLPLEQYQLKRLIIFINPDMDPLDSGYHMIQSRVAIGSGGLYGKGFEQGTQVQGGFLPEHHTDFIFSVVGEELGFVGASVVLGLYLLVLLRAIWIAFRAKDLLGSLIATGVVAMLAFQIMVNVGMTIGIMPVTGIPLPLLSYGGSGMIVNMTALGLVLGVNMRRKQTLFFGGDRYDRFSKTHKRGGTAAF